MLVIERGALMGRDQEWNISRPELMSLVPLGVLTQEQADSCVTIEFNPIRCGFHGADAPPLITKVGGSFPASLLLNNGAGFRAYLILTRGWFSSTRFQTSFDQ